MHAERLDRAGILQRQRDFRALREAAIHAQHAVRRAGGEGALAGGQGGEQKGVRGHGRVEELDDADADLVAHVGQVRAAPAHGVVGAAREPGVFRVEVLGRRKRGGRITATLFTRAETLFITVGILMMDDIIEGSVITGMPKSETSSRS